MNKLFGTAMVLFALYGPSYSSAQTEKDPYAGLATFNGYKFADFSGFEKWQMVTVRFRKDTGEQRFVYANPLAWNALKSGGTAYPDGAIFAKVAVMTEPDPAFESSAVPSGAERIQFMVKNAERHKDQAGWGYALFDRQGKTFPGEPKTAVIACHACHKIVPNRGYVFSQPMLKSFSLAGAAAPGALNYLKISPADLPLRIRSLLPAKAKSVSKLTGELSEHLFPGTLDEIRPSLIAEAISSGNPALLTNPDQSLFSLVYLDPESAACESGKRSFLSYVLSVGDASHVRKRQFCY